MFMDGRVSVYKTPEWKAWNDMIRRCYNAKSPNYRYYGRRGITVCARWQKSFRLFLKDLGPRPSSTHSLDRIDNAKDYTPGNCRWATRTEQHANARHVRLLTHDGRTQPLKAWAREIGIDSASLRQRIQLHGASVALNYPRREHHQSLTGAPGRACRRVALSATGFKGVYRQGNGFEAKVKSGKIAHYLGYFRDPESAARAYNAKAIELFGSFARLNQINQ